MSSGRWLRLGNQAALGKRYADVSGVQLTNERENPRRSSSAVWATPQPGRASFTRQCALLCRSSFQSSSSSRTTVTGSAHPRSAYCRSGWGVSRTIVSRLNGRDIADVLECGGRAIAKARIGGGPTILWCELDRLSSHTSSDDHRIYRTAEEIESLPRGGSDSAPRSETRASGELTPNDWAALQAECATRGGCVYRAWRRQPRPNPMGESGAPLSAPRSTRAVTVSAGRLAASRVGAARCHDDRGRSITRSTPGSSAFPPC